MKMNGRGTGASVRHRPLVGSKAAVGPMGLAMTHSPPVQTDMVGDPAVMGPVGRTRHRSAAGS
jgi:hypothetical protein